MNMIGAYGPWMAELANDPARLSFRNDEQIDIDDWRAVARQRTLDCLAMPNSGCTPQATIHDQYTYDGLHVEELSWQLPYGPPTEAILLNSTGSTSGWADARSVARQNQSIRV